MTTPLSILSLDQGKLFPQPKNEDDYYARFAGKPVKATKAASPRAWYVLDLGLLSMWVNPGR